MEVTRIWHMERFVFHYRTVFILLTIISAITIIGFVGFGWFQNPPSVEKVSNSTIYSNYAGVGAEQVRISIGLLLAVILFWLSDFIPKKFVPVPLCWIMVEYILWAVKSYQIYSTSENISYFKGSLYLYNASWWDIAIFILSTIAFVLSLLNLRSPKKEFSSNP